MYCSSHLSILDEISAIDFLLGGLDYSTGTDCFLSMAFNLFSKISKIELKLLED